MAVAPRGAPDDAGLRDAVRAALAAAPDLDATDIVVDVADGQAHLDGHVASPGDHDRAVAATRSVDGIDSVRSTLRVRPAPG